MKARNQITHNWVSVTLTPDQINLEFSSSPGEGPAPKLLDEHLTAILDRPDICALPRVMFVPVLLLFHWRQINKWKEHMLKKAMLSGKVDCCSWPTDTRDLILNRYYFNLETLRTLDGHLQENHKSVILGTLLYGKFRNINKLALLKSLGITLVRVHYFMCNKLHCKGHLTTHCNSSRNKNIGIKKYNEK